MNALRQLAFTIGHSLTARLIIIFFLLSLLYGAAARYAFVLFQDTDYLRRMIGAHFALHSEYILEDIGSPPQIDRAKAIVEKTPVDIRVVGPDMDWSSSPDFYPMEELQFGPLSLMGISEAGPETVEDWAKNLENVEFARYAEHTLVKYKDGDYDIIFVSPRISEMPAESNATIIIYLIGIFMLGICYFAVRWVFRPVSWMQEGARRFGQGELDYRIPLRGRRNDELGDLSRAMNSMADDVQGMLEAKRQLMLAISHELRSPLTRSKVALEMVDDDIVKNSILEDIDEMERLIADLLESEALNTRHAILRRELLDVGELIDGLVNSDFSQVKGQVRVAIAKDLPPANLDAMRIRLLLRNLIDNALRYNPVNGEPVDICARTEGGMLQLAVQDHGPGISAEHIEHVTEPFYRADPARSRTTGGVGLGLYLCRRIVEAHGGEIIIESSATTGTCVTATLALNET